MEEEYLIIVVYTIASDQKRDDFREKLIELGGCELDQSTYGFTKGTMKNIRNSVEQLCKELKVPQSDTVSILLSVHPDSKGVLFSDDNHRIKRVYIR